MRQWLMVWIWIVAAGVSGCKPVIRQAPITPSPEPSPPTAAPTQLPPIPTATLLPFWTATPESTPTPTAIPTPTEPACWLEGGQYDFAALQTDLLRFPLDVRVYVPPCYAQEPEMRYPVLYLIHGQSFTDDQWDRLGVDEHLDALIAAREVPPFLVVMPRDREWTQSNQDPFGKAFIEVLLPWVEANYRTLPERKYRAVGGLSRGAGWAESASRFPPPSTAANTRVRSRPYESIAAPCRPVMMPFTWKVKPKSDCKAARLRSSSRAKALPTLPKPTRTSWEWRMKKISP